MKRIIIAVTLLCFANTGFANEHGPKKGQFYIAPGGVAYEGPAASNIGHDDIDIGGGVIVGYSFSDRWSVEGLGAHVDSDFENSTGRGEDEVNMRWFDFLYKLDSSEAWQPFLLIGGGRTTYEFEGQRPRAKDNQFNVGAGMYKNLTDHIALRADIRGVSSSKEGGLSPMAFVGITGLFGKGSAPAAVADSDGDGVPNSSDKCPTTRAGATVDEDGCEVGGANDADGDGVADSADQCPNTPRGVAVDRAGCPRDSDGDGVPDYLDKCPGSEAGAKVDEEGCYIEIEEEVTIDMSIEFDTNKANIRPDHSDELGRAVRFLRQYPSTNAVIEGHTDSVGDAGYNQGLSERRAQAVYEYMVNDAGIAAQRLSSKGLGETQPIESNDTAEGRQKNRRVTAVVSGTHKVRQ